MVPQSGLFLSPCTCNGSTRPSCDARQTTGTEESANKGENNDLSTDPSDNDVDQIGSFEEHDDDSHTTGTDERDATTSTTAREKVALSFRDRPRMLARAYYQ